MAGTLAFAVPLACSTRGAPAGLSDNAAFGAEPHARVGPRPDGARGTLPPRFMRSVTGGTDSSEAMAGWIVDALDRASALLQMPCADVH